MSSLLQQDTVDVLVAGSRKAEWYASRPNVHILCPEEKKQWNSCSLFVDLLPQMVFFKLG